MSALRTAARKVLEATGLWLHWSLATRGPLHDDGWLRSFAAHDAVDADGRPVPWLTYPAVALLAARVRPEHRVFEYGCGNGTLWWAARVREVVACEHDRAWFERVRARAPGNVTLTHVPLERDGAYARSAPAAGTFDIVVIDGRDRVNCARHAIGALTAGGVMVWDDTDREEYRFGLEALAAAGFRRVPFVGLAPMYNKRAETSILYRDGNVLGL